jgi:hypothetical protein
LEQTSSESDSIHGIKQKIDAEIGIKEQHAELLNTPEVRRSCRFPQRVEKEDVESHSVAEINFSAIFLCKSNSVPSE